MSRSPVRDLIVGLFVLAGFAAIGYLSIELGGATYKGDGGLILYADFDEIGGLKARAAVVVGGVKVGQVTGVALDKDYRARVTMDVDARLKLPEDTSASILTAGVLGDQYVGLQPGGAEEMLGSGATIEYTQNAVILERLIGKVVQSIGGSSK